MRNDTGMGHESAGISQILHDSGLWSCHTTLRKFHGDFIEVPDNVVPYETLEVPGNMLLTGGVSAMLNRITGGTANALFDSTNACIGVGDSSTAEATAQTNLQAATNKLRKGMDSTYPQHTDTPATASSKTVTFRSTFASGEANFTWSEWGVFNNTTDGSGRMLNRKVQALGSKVAGATWQLAVSITIN